MLLGSAYGKVEVDSTGVTKGVKSATSSLINLSEVGDKVGAALSSLGKQLTVGVTLPILTLGAASVKYANDLGNARDKTNQVFGDMSKDVLKWSETTALAIGQSRSNALEMASTFGALFQQMNILPNVSADMSKSLVNLSADLAEFYRTDISTVTDALHNGLMGNTRTLKQFNIVIDESLVKQKALEMGLADSNGQFSEAALIQARYALILEKTANVQGYFAKNSKDLSAQTQIMKAQFQDTLAMLGENLIPLLTRGAEILNKLLTAFNNLTPGQQKIVIGFLAMAAAVGPVLSVLGTIIQVITFLSTAANTLSGLGITFAGVGTAITGTLVPALAAVGTALAPVLIVLAAIALYVGILYIMWKTNFLGMRDNVTMFVKVFKSLWAALLAFLRGDTDAALQHLGDAWDAFKERFTKFGSWENFKRGWEAFWTWLKTAMQNAVTYISKSFSNINWGSVGKYIMTGLANGMLLGIPNLLLAAKKAAESVLAQIKKSLGIASDSKEAIKLGFFTGHGFSRGVTMGMDPDAIARAIARPVTNSNSTQQTIVQNFSNGLTLRQAQSMIAENNEQLMNTMISALGGA